LIGAHQLRAFFGGERGARLERSFRDLTLTQRTYDHYALTGRLEYFDKQWNLILFHLWQPTPHGLRVNPEGAEIIDFPGQL
jgi:hypothetical protein